eukprot:CAMPEP_0202706666 /NCGR_PEP_ID=MMETSP1385-20130828/19058_1 /ASSEMBLY_ACC=CAM_ASM_000861 /TAXON_ID=933848 /ORGANISM="Elphidium margaritaceum" /LENGTH=505 /DNA_ID=CAMNT_0049365187 /DNA_START=114 /DNA_END=1631 /DNA_ORIENTATION=+
MVETANNIDATALSAHYLSNLSLQALEQGGSSAAAAPQHRRPNHTDPLGLMQSTTSSAMEKSRIAQVFHSFAAKVKRKQQKGNEKEKERERGRGASCASSRCTVNCFHTADSTTPKVASPPAPAISSPTSTTVASSNHSKSQPSVPNSKSPSPDTIGVSKPSMNGAENFEALFASKGYQIVSKLADSLQGRVYRCKVVNARPELRYHGDTVVIKATRKDLHSEGTTILENGQKKEIQENILTETDILQTLTFADAHLKQKERRSRFITRYVEFFENAHSYFLVMEDGGSDLFEYVVRCHGLIRQGKLDRKEWRLVCKKIFRQIVQVMSYMNEHNICHLDVSLENMLIQNGTVLQNLNTGKLSLNRAFTVKFCDFGLAKSFASSEAEAGFICNKFVGKTRYKSPELWSKKAFNAQANDIWSLGIALFMMIMGAPPLKYPDYADTNFKLIIRGDVLHLIQNWNRAKYMTPQVLDLLEQMLTKESQRITIEQIKAHSWVKLDQPDGTA